MSDEQDKLKVSLEPPKLFGRKKKSGRGDDTGSASEHPEPAPTAEEPTTEAEDAPTEAPAPAEAAAGEDEPEHTAHTDHAAFAPPETAEVPTADPAEAEDADAPVESRPESRPSSAPAAQETSVLPPVADDEPIIDEIETGLDEDEDDLAPVAAAPAAAASGPSLLQRVRDRVGDLVRNDGDDSDGGSSGGPASPGSDEDDSSTTAVPMLDHYPAAVLTGAIVGLGMVVLTWLSLRGCEAIRGTATCGGGPGFLLLVAMFIVSVMLGSAILKSFDVPDPGSSSFLAVGLVAVVALLLLIDVLDHWSSLVVIPVVTVGAYALSVFVTKTFVEPES
ncbi:hypothetical protein KUV85_15350 [Nocardioides panacisoli]|uniref:hypothetical protein n=1 Tax=Nocardioides panacisoli TaxID=627624 RepID=UPI001C6278DE|nr:hypothetical protein [Nocardioides panacisoli]QYJ03688.1 hypothetical protein KUV85_15350 [Nocardioides panacisoli]